MAAAYYNKLQSLNAGRFSNFRWKLDENLSEEVSIIICPDPEPLETLCLSAGVDFTITYIFSGAGQIGGLGTLGLSSRNVCLGPLDYTGNVGGLVASLIRTDAPTLAGALQLSRKVSTKKAYREIFQCLAAWECRCS